VKCTGKFLGAINQQLSRFPHPFLPRPAPHPFPILSLRCLKNQRQILRYECVEGDECVLCRRSQMKAIKLSAKHKKFIFIADYGDLHIWKIEGKCLTENRAMDSGQLFGSCFSNKNLSNES